MEVYEGLTVDEIVDILAEIGTEIIENKEDDGKLDAKEITLLVQLLIERLIEGMDDADIEDELEIALKVLKLASRFIPGDGLD
jgi:hypothetical protein